MESNDMHFMYSYPACATLDEQNFVTNVALDCMPGPMPMDPAMTMAPAECTIKDMMDPEPINFDM